MKIEEAIRTAIDYEMKIHGLYKQAFESTTDPVGKRIFESLKIDEMHHVKYLQDRLARWLTSNILTVEKLDSVIPDGKQISEAMGQLRQKMAVEDRKDEKQMLSKALQVEIETSDFYKQMVATLDGEAQKMFARFIEIEDEHIALVQAQLDYIGHTGYWFDFKEFDME